MSRLVNIATCAVDLNDRDGAIARRDIARAARSGTDIVCLPEWFPESPLEQIDFPELARQHRIYLIHGRRELDNDGRSFNSAVLLDRAGVVAGNYRKTHLSPNESAAGLLSAGDELPVFQTDCGVIGIAICMDIHFPEVFASLARRGAEIIFWPTACLDYTGDLIETLAKARAIDNQVYMVCSHYVQMPFLAGRHPGRSRVIDPMGRTRADTGHFAGCAITEIDLDQTYPMWYASPLLETYPTMRSVLDKTRRTDLK